jgi:hypothetical protein
MKLLPSRQNGRTRGFYSYLFHRRINMAQARPANEDTSTRHASNAERGGQQSAQQQESQREQQGSQRGRQQGDQSQERKPSVNVAVTTLRSLGQFFDMQAATMRTLMRAQMRAASVLGMPDYSRLYQINDDRALHLFSATTENLAQLVRQADGTFTEVPTQVFRLLEQQAIDATEHWKHGLEELEHQAIESMEELKQLSHQQADELARASESLTDATRETLREGGEQFRATVRQGREFAGRQTEAARKEAERTAGEMREAANQAKGEHRPGEGVERTTTLRSGSSGGASRAA